MVVDMDIVKTFAEYLSALETTEAKRRNPKPRVPKDYDEVERIIAEMLWENTGADIFDSGSIYGRHWEENRKISDFRSLPAIEVEVNKELNEFYVHVNVFHFLTRVLGRDETAKKLEKELYMFAYKPEYREKPWYDVIIEFVKEKEKELECGIQRWRLEWVANTYNFEHFLTQDLQFYILQNLYGDYYVILQIHNGCDVRGGYTKPRVFKVLDLEEFLESSVLMKCKCGSETLCACKPLELEYFDWLEIRDDKLVCKRCGSEVRFY